MAKSSNSAAPSKPAKPYPGFPLTPHPSGRWCKKIRRKLHYFGKLDNPDGALEKFNQEWPYLKDGRTPPPVDTGDGCTVKLLVNAFLTSKAAARDAGDLSPRSFRDYYATCELLISSLGKDRRVDDLRPDDFERLRARMAEGWGPVTLLTVINRVRVILKYAFDQRLIDAPVHFGQSFNRPSVRSLRVARNEAGTKLFTSAELKRILKASGPQLHAMVLLGLNCGFGNTDVASLPQRAVNLKSGWLEFPRPKTAIQRRIPLWPETVKALRKAIATRQEARDAADGELVFLTSKGTRWVRMQPKRPDVAKPTGPDEPEVLVPVDALSAEFRKVLKALSINGRRGLGFYTLRHNFETWAGESKDQVAVNAIMGHVDDSMASSYRESISDARLRGVVETVHKLAFPKPGRKRGREGSSIREKG